MKIFDAPFRFNPVEPEPATRRLAFGEGLLDNGDLQFLQMMTALQEQEAAAAGVLGDVSPEEAPKPAKTEKKAPTTASETANANTPLVKDPVEADLQQDLADIAEINLLQKDLQPVDLQTLQTLNAAGNPIIVPFQQLVSQQGFSLDGVEASGSGGLPISKGLSELLEKASRTGRPIRVALDDQSAVVLKINQGKVSAEFLSADVATALYLKQHVAELRAKMDARQLPVGSLSYREDEPNGQGQRQTHDSKQNDA